MCIARQVESLVARLPQRQAGGGAGARGGGAGRDGGAGSARRMRDGQRILDMALEVWWLKFGVQGAGFRVQASGFRVQASGCRLQASGYRVTLPPPRRMRDG